MRQSSGRTGNSIHHVFVLVSQRGVFARSRGQWTLLPFYSYSPIPSHSPTLWNPVPSCCCPSLPRGQIYSGVQISANDCLSSSPCLGCLTRHHTSAHLPAPPTLAPPWVSPLPARPLVLSLPSVSSLGVSHS